MDAFAATRFAVGSGCLVVAAASDLRTRRVRDPLWIGLGTFGLVLLGAELAGAESPWTAWSLLGSAAILFYTVFLGRPLFDVDGFHPRPIRILLFFIAAALFFVPLGTGTGTSGGPPLGELASMPVVVVVYQLFYRIRLLHGGADTKGLIALTLLIPSYPDARPFPLVMTDPRMESILRLAFPFSLVVWVDAAIVTLAVPLGMLLYNAIRRDLALPQAFLGFRALLEHPPRHAWLMERITDGGEHVLVLFPRRGGDSAAEVAKLRARGIKRVWFALQIPFMVPLSSRTRKLSPPTFPAVLRCASPWEACPPLRRAWAGDLGTLAVHPCGGRRNVPF